MTATIHLTVHRLLTVHSSPVVALAFLLLVSGIGPTTLADEPPPNVVIIVSDDQGYADLGSVNGDVITPALDRIASEGVRLTSFYVAWPACTPSRAAFLSGRYPQRNGIYDMIRNEAPDHGYKYTPAEYEVTFERIGGMDTREILFPQLLQQTGYRTAIFGKWDLGSLRRYLPLQRGFDEFYGFVNTGIDYFTHERYGVPSMYSGNHPTTQDRGTYCTELFEREAIRFIRENHARPFLLYLPFNAPHNASSLDPAIRSAAQAPEETKQLYPQLEDTLIDGHKYGQPAQIASRSKRRLEYVAAITRMDEAIGRLLDLLDEYEIADRTFVLFFSDNGGSGGADNSPLRGSKGLVYEGGIRVCALARYPAAIPAGSRCDEFLTSLEVMPTLLNLADVQPPDDLHLDGFDMLPVLAGRLESSRRQMAWKRRDLEALRYDNWKWVRTQKAVELFDLAKDPAESRDLARTNPDLARQLQQRFEDWLSEMDAAPPRGPFRDY